MVETAECRMASLLAAAARTRSDRREGGGARLHFPTRSLLSMQVMHSPMLCIMAVLRQKTWKFRNGQASWRRDHFFGAWAGLAIPWVRPSASSSSTRMPCESLWILRLLRLLTCVSAVVKVFQRNSAEGSVTHITRAQWWITK